MKKTHNNAINYLICLSLFLGLSIWAMNRTGAKELPRRPDDHLNTVKVIDNLPEGSQIKLLGDDAYDHDDWTVVQWRSDDGTWHDVTGWQGTFWEDGTVTWWVGEDNIGEKNFRWLIYADESKTNLLKTSDAFDLPVTTRTAVIIEIK